MDKLLMKSPWSQWPESQPAGETFVWRKLADGVEQNIAIHWRCMNVHNAGVLGAGDVVLVHT